MLERSVQAQFLIPMAISLAFGVLFATAITLLVVPAGCVILEDLRRGGASRPEDDDTEEDRTRPRPVRLPSQEVA